MTEQNKKKTEKTANKQGMSKIRTIRNSQRSSKTKPIIAYSYQVAKTHFLHEIDIRCILSSILNNSICNAICNFIQILMT